MVKDSTEILHIKNMVCPRCVTVVRQTLEEAGLAVQNVELGKAWVKSGHDISAQELDSALKKHGFELIDSKDQQLVEQIKTLLIQYVQQLEQQNENPKLSDYLSEHLHKNYASLSSSFSQSENTTLEKYLIHLKIERVKELLSYNELTLSEIAFKLNYSSVAHLSNQFKQVAGMSPTDYKKAQQSFRKSLDEV